VERIGEGASFAAPVKSEVKLQEAPFALEALPPASEGAVSSTQLLVSYTNGIVDCITPDGTRLDWKYSGDGSSKPQIEHATIVDFDTAKKGILKERQDLATAVSASISGSSLLFMRVARTKKQAVLQIFKIRNASLQQAGSTVSGLDFLEAIPLPDSAASSSETNASWEVHAASGQISQLSEGRLTVYDLTTLTPRIQSKLGNSSEPITSCTRTSSSSILAISAGVARLYESRFGSVQASVTLGASVTTESSKKRKRENGAESESGVRVVSSFSDVGLVAAIEGTQLVSFQLTADARDSKRGRATGSSLIDAIGKASTTGTQENEKVNAKWEEWKSKVDKLADASDVAALEEFLSKDLALAASLQSADAEVDDDVFQMSTDSYDPTNVDREKALHLLGRIFARDGVSQILRLALRSPIAIQWLALAGLLSAEYVSKAVTPGELARALGTADDSFELLHDVLDLPVFFQTEEIVEALKILIESLDTPSSDISQLALPPPAPTDADIEMEIGDADPSLEVETLAAEKELHHALSALQNGLEVRSQSLRLIFARLRSFPAKSVKDVLRKRLSQKELVFFIQVLRIELAEGGWTSRYIDVGNDEYANRIEATDKQPGGSIDQIKGPSDQAIRHIGQLLTCAIDAISTSGWLVGLSGNVDITQEILDSVRAEVSASLEGCLEAKTLERSLQSSRSMPMTPRRPV
jgi:hypothetical protein